MAIVTTSLSERCGAGPGRSKACWIIVDPFIVSSTMVKMVVRTMALSSIGSTLLVCLCWLQTKVYYRSHFLSPTRTKRTYISWTRDLEYYARRQHLGNHWTQLSGYFESSFP